MEIWHIWVIAGIILFILEIFTPGFLLACFGLGCLSSGLSSYLGLGLKMQVIFFSASSLAIIFFIRPFILKHFYSSSGKVKTNVDALTGRTGLVLEKIDNKINKGRVKIGGEDWKGFSEDGSKIEAGTEIKVVKVEGTKVIVKPNKKEKEEEK